MKGAKCIFALMLSALSLTQIACSQKKFGLIQMPRSQGVPPSAPMRIIPEKFPEALSVKQSESFESTLIAIEVENESFTLVGLTPFFSRAYVIRYESGQYVYEPGPQAPPVPAETLILAVLKAFAFQDGTAISAASLCEKIDKRGTEFCNFKRHQDDGTPRFSLNFRGRLFYFYEASLSD